MSAVYQAQLVARAREHAAAGWMPSEILGLLAREFGDAPSVRTVQRWVRPADRAAEAAATLRRNQARVEARRLSKLREGRDRGMSFKSLAIAAGIFLGVELSADQVKRRLEGKRGYAGCERSAA